MRHQAVRQVFGRLFIGIKAHVIMNFKICFIATSLLRHL